MLNPLYFLDWTLADTVLDTRSGPRKQTPKNGILGLIFFGLRAELFASGKWERAINGMQWHYDFSSNHLQSIKGFEGFPKSTSVILVTGQTCLKKSDPNQAFTYWPSLTCES